MDLLRRTARRYDHNRKRADLNAIDDFLPCLVSELSPDLSTMKTGRAYSRPAAEQRLQRVRVDGAGQITGLY